MATIKKTQDESHQFNMDCRNPEFVKIVGSPEYQEQLNRLYWVKEEIEVMKLKCKYYWLSTMDQGKNKIVLDQLIQEKQMIINKMNELKELGRIRAKA